MEKEEVHFVGKIAQKAIIEKGGKVLVSKGIGDSIWEFPGGRLHIDEQPLDGIRREIFEELNISMAVYEPVHVCRSLHAKSNTWRILIAYRCSIQEDAVTKTDPEEVEEIKWISPHDLKILPMFDDCREIADVYLKVKYGL